MSRYLSTLTTAVLTLAAGALEAGPVAIPNASFESPTTLYAGPFVDSWQQAPSPYSQQTGVFLNLPPGDPSHITNCDGAQAAFFFASQQVALFQDYDSTDYTNSTPTHAFDAAFEVGKSYTLTVGVIGGTNLAIPMQEGATLELSLYYRDNAGDKHTAAATTITNSGAAFGLPRQFVDYHVHLPTVQPGDAWAGRHIGVQFLSTVSPELEGGYWDLDNVRLFSAGAPALLDPVWTNGQFTFSLESDPGLRFEILATADLTLPLSNWTSLGTLTNTTGTAAFLDPDPLSARRFYQARQLP